jgi:FMN phosphatase YigB (HAD superfamily)
LTIRLVCFDLGGVLVRICRSWEEVCIKAGVECRPSPPESVLARCRELNDLHQRGQLALEAWAELSSRAQSGLYTTDELIRIYDSWTVGEYDGVGSLVAELHEAGMTTACLSNTTHGHWRRLAHTEEALRTTPEFPVVYALKRRFASHLMQLAKPDPAIYCEFERATETDGPEILFFDDLPRNIAAAKAAGWNAELIDPLTETAPQLREYLHTHGVLRRD